MRLSRRTIFGEFDAMGVWPETGERRNGDGNDPGYDGHSKAEVFIKFLGQIDWIVRLLAAKKLPSWYVNPGNVPRTS